MPLPGAVRPSNRRGNNSGSLRSILVAFASTIGFAAMLIAGTYSVTNTGDFGPGSLRHAIQAANDTTGTAVLPACPAPCTITFAVAGDITTTLGLLPPILVDAVTIQGPGTDTAGDMIVGVRGMVGQSAGFDVQADNVIIEGLSISNYQRQIIAGAVDSTIIRNNFLGLDRAGNPGAGQNIGIQLTGSSNSVIGQSGLGNVIGGIAGGPAMEITGTASDSTISHNLIGVGPDGTAAQPNNVGIYLWGASTLRHRIENNVIANSAIQGVRIDDPASSNPIVTNSFFSNAFGIDIGAGANDPGDADTGGNNLQNYPEIENATLTGPDLNVQVTVDSSGVGSINSLLVEIFEADATGNGETLLGSQCYDTNHVQSQVMTLPYPGSGAGSGSITATATSYSSLGCEAGAALPWDGTSEFAPAAAAVAALVVNNTQDNTTDGDATQTSLREALEAQSGCGPGCQILFNIPGAGDPGFNGAWYTIDVASPLPPITTPGLEIRGDSQTAFTGNTNGGGPEIFLSGLPAAGNGLHIQALATAVDGVVIVDLVIGNFPGHGILVDGPSFSSDGNIFFGNYIGTNPTGTLDAGNGGSGISLSGLASNNVIGGPNAGEGNVISGNSSSGIGVTGSGGHVIEGNIIGADRTGASPIPNGGDGIILQSANNRAGGTPSFVIIIVDGVEGSPEASGDRPVRRQLVRRGFAISAPLVLSGLPAPEGNLLAFNAGSGVHIGPGGWFDNDIVKNLIHSNGGRGVSVNILAGSGNRIVENSIHSNGLLGIDIGNDGVDPQDGIEGAGPNERIDYPTIVDAVYDGTDTTIYFTYASNDSFSQDYRFHFYENDAADPSGFGEGETLVVIHDETFDSVVGANGSTIYQASYTGDGRPFQITGTATDIDDSNSTSEFSAALGVRSMDLGITKSGPASVTINQAFSYTLTVVNSGPQVADVTVIDNLPAGVTFVNASQSSSTTGTTYSCGEVTGTVTCTADPVNDSDISTITIDVIAPSTTGPITNSATVSTLGTDVDPTNDTSNTVTTAVNSAEMTILKTANPEPVLVGAPLTYTVTVQNVGGAPATGLTVIDNLPVGVTFVSATGVNWSCGHATGTVSCSYTQPSLAPAASSTITINVLAPTSPGTITNVATVSVTAGTETNTTDNSDSVDSTVEPLSADLTLDKTAPATVETLELFDYTLTVNNTGPDDAAAVTLVDTLPTGVTYQSDSAGCSHLAGTVTCNLGTIVALDSVVVTISVTAPPTAGPITNSASVSSTTPDPTTPNTDTATTSVALPDADLSLSKSAPATALTGSPISYLLTVLNSGPSPATGVVILDTLPAGFTYDSFSGAGWTCIESIPGSVDCSLAGPLASGNSSSVTLNVTTATTPATYTNSASTVSNENDPDGTDNGATADTVVTDAAADLSLSKTGPATALTGEAISYVLTVSNAGPQPATNVSVVDTLPAGFTFDGFSGSGWSCSPVASTVQCDLSTPLGNGSSSAVTLDVTTAATPGPYTNSATASADETDSNGASDTTTTTLSNAAADLSLTKTGPAFALTDEAISYGLTVSNGGPQPATNVVITDTLPAGFTFNSASGSGWSCSAAGATVQCTLATLANGVSSSVTLNVTTASTAGTYTNNASASADEADSNGANDSATTTVADRVANLSVMKTGPSTATVNEAISYAIQVNNDGPEDATNLTVVDPLPAGFNYVSFSGSGWSCSETVPDTVQCVRPLLGAESLSTVTLNVTVAPTAGTYTNTATASSDEVDPTPASGSATTTVEPPKADLSIQKIGPSEVEEGELITWTLSISNDGPIDAASPTVTDNLPSAVSGGSASGSGWACTGTTTITCTWTGSTFPADSTSTILVTATAPDSASTFTNQASVSSTTPDSDSGNNSDSFTTSVADPCPSGLAHPVSPLLETVDSPVTFIWEGVRLASSYEIFIERPGEEPVMIAQAGAGDTSVTVPVEGDGSLRWFVRTVFRSPCPPVKGPTVTFFLGEGCPTGVPILLEPTVDDGDVVLRWTEVDSAVEYRVFASIDGGPVVQIGQVAAGSPTLLETQFPAGARVLWYVEAHFGGNCPPGRSADGEILVPCFAPILSVPGMVTTDKPYEVRATIVTEGLGYLFEESTVSNFTENLVVKPGQLDPTGEFIFAEFDHAIDEPTAFFYRVRLDQAGCAYSVPPGRIVVIPIEVDSVVQFGNEEIVRRPLFIPSPEPESPASFNFLITTDREWLTVEPNAGTLGPEGITVTLITDPIGLPVGTNTGTVIVQFTEISTGKQALSSHETTTSTPVSVTLVTPVTNTGKGEPVAESLVVPAVAHAAGLDSEWNSDIRLVNLGTVPETYALNFTMSGEDGTVSGKSSEIELAPGQTTALDDVVKQWYGLGALPGENATGVLEIRPLSRAGKGAMQVPVTKTLTSVASSRTYNVTPDGTTGQFIPAIPYAAFVGASEPESEVKEVLSLQQVAESTAYRTNLGVVEASGNPATVALRIFDASGGLLLSLPIELMAGEHRQFNQILAQNGLSGIDLARAELEVVGGAGRIAAYASVVDNMSNDPLLVQAVNLAHLGARRYVVPGMAHFDTGGARWRSDLQLFNAGASPVQATVSFFRQGSTTVTASTTLDLQPGTITALGDVVPTIFGQTNTGGAVQVTTATDSDLVVTARTYDQTAEGTYGQFIPAVTEEQAIGMGDRAMQVLQMEESVDIRTNLGLVEVTGQPVTIELTAHAAESRVIPRIQLTLSGNEFRQLNRVLRGLNVGNTYNARVSLRVVSGQGKIVAYGSAVDNKTDDPTYVPGQ